MISLMMSLSEISDVSGVSQKIDQMRLGERLSHSSTSTPPNCMIATSLESQEASAQATSWMMSYAPLERSKCYIFPKVTNI
jgi:hypothetical protein